MKYINYLIKPASSLCNLRCKYCFYEDEAINRSLASTGLMKLETVDNIINKSYQEIEEFGMVGFAFQGGEPTVAGLEFFKCFVNKAKENKPKNVSISFSMQTNGTLLTDDWAKFLHDEKFLVGLSIDGYKDLHNMHRIDASGKDTFNKVLNSLALLNKYKVDVNVLCVVTSACAKHPLQVYQSLKKLGFRYLQFIGCLDPIGIKKGSMPYSLTPEAYGDFLCKIFDLWFNDYQKYDYHSIRLFDDYIHSLIGDNQSTCATCGKCGGYFVIEGDGSAYPCDFFALDNYKVGNINNDSLVAIKESQKYKEFLLWGLEKPEECYSCKYRVLCNGGCKNDWIKIDDKYHNYYCKSFTKLFDYSFERMKYIANNELLARRGR